MEARHHVTTCYCGCGLDGTGNMLATIHCHNIDGAWDDGSMVVYYTIMSFMVVGIMGDMSVSGNTGYYDSVGINLRIWAAW